MYYIYRESGVVVVRQIHWQWVADSMRFDTTLIFLAVVLNLEKLQFNGSVVGGPVDLVRAALRVQTRIPLFFM